MRIYAFTLFNCSKLLCCACMQLLKLVMEFMCYQLEVPNFNPGIEGIAYRESIYTIKQLTGTGFAGVVYLLAFFAWGALNLGNRLFGRCALWLWSIVVAYSALLIAARCGMHLAYTIGRTHWSEESLVGQILSLLGFTAAENGWQYVLVHHFLQRLTLCTWKLEIQGHVSTCLDID